MVVCTIVVGLALAWISGFLDKDELLKRQAARSFAPLLTQTYGTSGQQRITVVTIDDGDLDEYGLHWPVPLDFHGRLIGRIASQKPKAIFLDMLFVDDRPPEQAQALARAACVAAQTGVRVYFASYQRADLSSNVEHLLLSARTPEKQPCAFPVQAPVEVDRLDQHQWNYPLTVVPGKDSHDRARLSRSVALSLYCDQRDNPCPGDTSEPMALLWPTEAADSNLKIMVRFGLQGELQPVCRGRWDWWEAVPFHSFVPRLWQWARGLPPEKTLPLCPYNKVVPASAFKGIGFTSDELKRALEGRYVLVGLDLAGINDHVLSPVHGRLPGVHAHAVALDNLITLQGRYMGGGGFEWPWVGREAGLSPATGFSLVSVVLIAFTLVAWKAVKRWRLDAARSAGQDDTFTTWSRLSGWVQKHAQTRAKALRWLILALVLAALLACLLSLAGGPGRLIPLLVLVLALWIFTLGGPLLGSYPLQGRALRWRLAELVVYGVLSFAIVLIGAQVFHQGPLAIVEYVGLTALADLLGWGEKVAKHAAAFWRALADPEPVEAWNRHAMEQVKKRQDP